MMPVLLEQDEAIPTAGNAAPEGEQHAEDRGRIAHGSYVLLIVFLVFSFQFVDRQLIAILAQPIKKEFGLSDSQIGLMTGFIFSVPYALTVFPVGYLADRYNRRNLLAIAVTIWSFLTLLTGFVRNLTQLVLTRVLIATAEAANNPTALSLISDYFDKDRRATAVGIYFAGPAFGSAVAFTLIGYIAQMFGWRAAFFLAGGPGLMLAILLLLTVREPERETLGHHPPRMEAPSVRDALGFAFRQRGLMHLLVAMTLGSMAISANIAWMAPFLIRVHHFSLTGTAATIAVGFGLTTAAGQILGGTLVDRWARQDKTRVAWSCAGFSAIAFIFMVAASITPWSGAAIFLIAAWAVPAGLQYGPVGGTILTLVIPRMRGVVASLYALMLNLIGFGVGPFVVGKLSDIFQARLADRSLQAALAIIAFCQLAAVLHFVFAARHINHDLVRAETYGG